MYATETDARSAYAGEDANPARLRAVMLSAAGWVSRIAPAPSEAPVTGEYYDLASGAELLAGEYLWRGFVTREDNGGRTAQYGTTADVEAAIGSVMGAYAEGSVAGGYSGTLEVASTFPPPDPNDLPTP